MATSSNPEPLPELTAHADFLRALARRLVNDEAAADDVVQDVWLRSLRRPPSAAGDLRAWLARVARSVVSDRHRSDAARARRERATARLEESTTESELAERLAIVDELGRALAALPEEYRRALHLRYYEDRSPEEIAARSGCPVATVKTRLRRGLQLLREDMRDRTRGRGDLRALLLPLCVGADATRSTGAVATGVLIMKKTIVAATLLLAVAGAVWFAQREPRTASLGSALAAQPLAEPRAETPDDGPLAVDTAAAASANAPSREVVATPTASVMSGRVVYASTGQGVPYFTFALHGAGDREALTTDRAGRFTSRRAHPLDVTLELPHEPPGDRSSAEDEAAAGAFALDAVVDAVGASRPIVVASTPQRFEWSDDTGYSALTSVEQRVVSRADASEELEVAVHLGPTFFLDASWPAGTSPEQFRASYAAGADPFASSWRRVAPVQGTPEAWVRFPHSTDLSSGEPLWTVALESQDGDWVGSASAPYALGVVEAALRVRFAPCARVVGRVTDDAGEPLPEMFVKLQSRTGDEQRGERSDGDGRFEFRRVLEGSYVVHVQDTHYFPWESAVQVRSGDPTTVDIRLAARPPGGNLRGRITSSSGTFDGRVVLFLEGIEDQDVWRRCDPVWFEEDGRLVATYAFDDLGSGSYRVTCCTIDAVRVEDRDRVLSPPNESADFLIDDAGGARTLGLSARDASSGDALPSFQVYFHPRGNVEVLESGTADAPWTRDVYEGVRFTWRLHAPGYRAVTGDESSFPRPGVLDVDLEPGFSAVVHVLSIESLRSIPTVEIFADGRSVGWTDQDGFLFVDLPERPRRITVDPTAWVIHDSDTFSSDFDAERGFDDWEEREVFLSAYLRPVR